MTPEELARDIVNAAAELAAAKKPREMRDALNCLNSALSRGDVVAAAYLETLRAKAQVAGWIAVTDRLPEVMSDEACGIKPGEDPEDADAARCSPDVLVWDGVGVQLAHYYPHNWGEQNNPAWWDAVGTTRLKPTHWQPLPLPPIG